MRRLSGGLRNYLLMLIGVSILLILLFPLI